MLLYKMTTYNSFLLCLAQIGFALSAIKIQQNQVPKKGQTTKIGNKDHINLLHNLFTLVTCFIVSISPIKVLISIFRFHVTYKALFLIQETFLAIAVSHAMEQAEHLTKSGHRYKYGTKIQMRTVTSAIYLWLCSYNYCSATIQTAINTISVV